MRGQERLEHDRQPRNSTIRVFQLFQWVPVQNCLACVGGEACCKESAITTSLHLSSFVRSWGTPSKCRHWWKVIQYPSHVTHESKLYLTFVPVETHMQKFDSKWHLRKSISSKSTRSRISWADWNDSTWLTPVQNEVAIFPLLQSSSAVHNVYFVKYDVTLSFLAQVLDTVTYFVSQVLDTAS